MPALPVVSDAVIIRDPNSTLDGDLLIDFPGLVQLVRNEGTHIDAQFYPRANPPQELSSVPYYSLPGTDPETEATWRWRDDVI